LTALPVVNGVDPVDRRVPVAPGGAKRIGSSEWAVVRTVGAATAPRTSRNGNRAEACPWSAVPVGTSGPSSASAVPISAIAKMTERPKSRILAISFR